MLTVWVGLALVTSSVSVETWLSVATYNILADVYASPERYRLSGDELAWNSRWPRIRSRLQEIDPDVLFLQEVQVGSHVARIAAALSAELDVLFVRRARGKLDGCALLFKRSMFALVDHVDVDLDDGSKGNVGLAAVLKHASAPAHHCLVASTAHLHWNPDEWKLKEAQAERILDATRQLSLKHGCLSVLVAGDWNSFANSSVVKHILKDRVLSLTRADVNEPTTITETFNATIDHVFFSGMALLDARVHTRSPWLPMPNADEPSDHFPLVARFSL
jgi:mRNA deadenylase 3'-5' endonuclease subunit Ccr4